MCILFNSVYTNKNSMLFIIVFTFTFSFHLPICMHVIKLFSELAREIEINNIDTIELCFLNLQIPTI